jgi:hypothetical protein
MKVLVIGHGRRMWREREIPRCAPMSLDEWNHIVQDAHEDNVTFLDFCEEEQPDILENAGNNWAIHLESAINTYDFVIDAVTHMSCNFRKSACYWYSIYTVLNNNGMYIGWDESPESRKHSHIRIPRNMIYAHISEVYGNNIVYPKKRFNILQCQKKT